MSVLLTVAVLLAAPPAGPSPATPPASAKGVFSFQADTIDGQSVALSKYQGKALVIVNTASRCDYTPQYKGLEALYQRYKDRGLVVLAFPSNDFGAQEPGSNAEIRRFCRLTYRVTFPLFAKVTVKGEGAHPLYKYLTGLAENGGEVTWNFNKFLVAPDGAVVAHMPAGADPTSEDFQKKVEAILPRPSPAH
ncbi:MAG: glutathione peroxidase [Myxococcota bacterium]